MDLTKALVVCDGNIASSVLLAQVLKDKGPNNVHSLHISFGLPTDNLQLSYVQQLAFSMVGLNHDLKHIDLSNITKVIGMDYFKDINLANTKHELQENYKPRIPFKQGLVISTAVAYAYSRGIRVVYVDSIRTTLDDRWDTVTDFNVPIANAVIAGTCQEVIALMPFERDYIEHVVERGVKLGVPFEHTWSCCNEDHQVSVNMSHCGICEGCLERKRGFEKAGYEDKTRYMHRD